MPAIFGDHMVLQQGAKIPFWGTADPGEKITVTAGDHTGSSTTGADGKWRVDLESFPEQDSTVAPAPITVTVTVAGKNMLKFDDVLIGEVWVASGQSNMEWSLGAAHDAAEEVPKANDPQLRLFYVGHTPSIDPQTNLQGQWKLCTPDAAAPFSALAYFFGHELRTHFNRPVGIIDSCVGGTPARSWISLSGLEKEPPFTQDVDLAKSVKPGDPVEQDRHTPTVLYNGMIAPLMPYAIKGVIWYQGEDNAITTQLSVEYRTLFPRLITDWREKWGQGDFPFITMQLSSFTRDDIGGPGGVNWPILREAQAKTLSLPHTGIVATYDIGAGTDIHPKDKLDVGKRLALDARHVAYGEDIVYSGPTNGTEITNGFSTPTSIRFENAGSGLVIGSAPWTAPGLQPIPTTSLLGFTIAGADKKFYPADAKITSIDTVAVSSRQVSSPVAVRYYWDNLTQGNLYNKEGLPAFPFRTDDWDDVPSPVTP